MNWFIDVNKDHLIVILVMWLFLLMWFLCKSFCQMIAKSPEEQHIRQKGLETIKDTKKENPKFLLIPIFSNPSANFNLTGKITVHILYEKNPHIKEQIKLARIDLDGSRAETVRQLCCCLFYRWYVWFERKRYMPPITHVQAGHDSAKGETVFFEGIEVQHPDDGYALFYPVREQVHNVGIDFKDIKAFVVKPPKLFIPETFCPNFYSLSVETFGDKFVHPNTSEVIKGVKVQPKLNWFETLLFFAVLITGTYCTMFGILTFCAGKADKSYKSLVIVLAIFVSSFVALLVTELLAYIYRRGIKGPYNARMTANETSLLWLIIVVFCYLLLLVISFLATVIPSVLLVSKDELITKKLHLGQMPEYVFLLLCLGSALTITFTIGIIIFGLIRYFIRWLTFDSYSTQHDIEKAVNPHITTEPTDTTEQSTLSDKVVVRKETGQDLNQIKHISQVGSKDKNISERTSERTTERAAKSKKKEEETKRSSKKSPEMKPKVKTKAKSGKRLDFNTDRLEKELIDKEKNKKLVTQSVITQPRSSKGFENPEKYRLIDSKTDI